MTAVSALQDSYRHRAALDTDIRHQMPVLYAHARHARVIIELGVRGGNSTAALLAGCEYGGGHLWSVDCQKPETPAEWDVVPFWHVLVADDISAEAAGFCPPQADVLFIDTSHAYEHTLAELRLYVPRVVPGGVVLLHDTDRVEWPGVGQALDEFCGETGAAWYDHPGWHGLGVIEVPRA